MIEMSESKDIRYCIEVKEDDIFKCVLPDLDALSMDFIHSQKESPHRKWFKKKVTCNKSTQQTISH